MIKKDADQTKTNFGVQLGMFKAGEHFQVQSERNNEKGKQNKEKIKNKQTN